MKAFVFPDSSAQCSIPQSLQCLLFLVPNTNSLQMWCKCINSNNPRLVCSETCIMHCCFYLFPCRLIIAVLVYFISIDALLLLPLHSHLDIDVCNCKMSNFLCCCVPSRAKQDTVCYYGNRGSSEPIRLNPGLCFYYGCCKNRSFPIHLSSWPPARPRLPDIFCRCCSLLVSFAEAHAKRTPSWDCVDASLYRSCCLSSAGIYGLSNSLLDTPWKKLLKGKEHFTNVVGDQSLSGDGLVQALLHVLNNEELWVTNTHAKAWKTYSVVIFFSQSDT